MNSATRTATASLEEAASAFVLRDRASLRDGVVRASFARSSPRRRFDLTVDLPQKRAQLVASDGRRQSLVLGEDAGTDAGAWHCDCPAHALGVCLHAVLAAAALTREVEANAEDDTPDGRFACGGEASETLLAAANASMASIDKLDDAVRVGEAKVHLVGASLGCDCPLGKTPTCLHRVLVDAWARGARPARPQASGFTPQKAMTRLAEDSPVTRTVAGEKLPVEDVERFEPVLSRVETLLAELVCYGLQRTNDATRERLFAIITAARALGIRESAPRHAGLGRLVRALERLVQILGEFQDRIVTTTEVDVLRELGILRNIVRAVRANVGVLPLSEFAGATQQEYVTAPALDIQGLGFEAWTTPTGYGGVTAYVANLRNGQILTRTNSLPANQDGSAVAAGQLASMAAFAGSSVSFLEVARSRFLLSGAQIALDSGRLSGSSKTQVAKREGLELSDPKLRRTTVMGGADALRIARRLAFDPLGRPPSAPPVGLLPIKDLGAPRFDRRTQTFFLDLVTPSVTLPCVVGYRDDRALWIDNLEKLGRSDTKPLFVFARLRVDAASLSVEPLTAYFAGQKGRLDRRHLTFQELDP